MNPATKINQPSVMFASTFYIGVAFLIYNMLPVILKSAGDSLGINEQQIGYLGSVYMAGSAISNVVAVFWVRRLNWQVTTFISSLAACSCYLLAAEATYQQLLLLFFTLGLVNAAIVSCVFTCMGDTKNPNRAFGYGIGFQVILAGIGSFVLPVFIIPYWNFAGVAVFLAISVIITIPMAFLLPKAGIKGNNETHNLSHTNTTIKPLTAMIWGFSGLFIYFVGQSGVWAFFGRIGGEGGLSDQQLGFIFGPTLMISAAGGFLTGWFSSRFDRRLMIIGSITLGVLSLLILMMPFGTHFWMFLLSVLLYCLSWNFVMPFMMTIITENDINGSFAPLVPACQLFGSVVGPAASGHLITNGSYFNIYLLAIISVVLCAIIFVSIDNLGRKRKTMRILDISDVNAISTQEVNN